MRVAALTPFCGLLGFWKCVLHQIGSAAHWAALSNLLKVLAGRHHGLRWSRGRTTHVADVSNVKETPRKLRTPWTEVPDTGQHDEVPIHGPDMCLLMRSHSPRSLSTYVLPRHGVFSARMEEARMACSQRDGNGR